MRLDQRIKVVISICFVITISHYSILDTLAREVTEESYVSYSLKIDNYSPGDFSLSILDNNENSDNYLIRGWIENKYSILEVENFIDTREVLDYYEYEPAYINYVNWNSIMNDLNSFYPIDSNLNDLGLSHGKLNYLSYNQDEHFWLHTYIRKFHSSSYAWLTEEVEPNSIQVFDYGFQNFQGFTDWRRELVYPNDDRPLGNFYHIWVPHQKQFLVNNGQYEIPIYKTENYTRYRYTIREITDWTKENWPNLNTTIKLTGFDGYNENVQVSVSTDNTLIKTNPENQIIHVGSTAKTNLEIELNRELQGSTHQIKITASDDFGRKKHADYSLELETSEKPPIENEIIDQWESDTKPDDDIESINYEPNNRMGVEGRVYDANTGEEVSNNLTVTVNELPASIQGNYYQNIWVGTPDETGSETMIIHVDSPGYNPQWGSATDSWMDYSIAYKNFYLFPI
ncbi:MAG: hypothetical protein KGY45_01480 [Hadesarchaea archaeon]|nr:hypothetical protein [Hadesarchaea archaeon]